MGKPVTDLLLSKDDLFLFAKGEWFRSYEKLGAHPAMLDGQEGYHFAVWVPDVESVHVMGDFNDWDSHATPLTRTAVSGVWHGFVPGVMEGACYKYVIVTKAGDLLYKADPYAFRSEDVPGTASRTVDIDDFSWSDEGWMANRAKCNHLTSPLNIFEVHLGSWRRHDDATEEGVAGSYYTYDELSSELVDYVRDMGYTHVEILPVCEHPFDGSWGYQVTGYFAPTSRYGTPCQFKHFVDACHAAGVGVIMDWVPSGFCRDEQGLVHFNGTKLFETEEHPTWGTLKFNFDRNEVRSFLISNLLYWIDEYHADGIRMNGVTSMLYLNYGIDDPWFKRYSPDGSENDYSSVNFLRRCNDVVHAYHPDVMIIAEESTAWPHVTAPTSEGGLGFDYKWDMGAMNDLLRYTCCDFQERPYNHELLTRSISYVAEENFILPFSHDEVVHGKRSLLCKQPGDYWRQMAGLRVLALLQMTRPSGKLNFMGNEIGQFIEWRYFEGIEYHLVEEGGAHAQHQRFIRRLNEFYRAYPALWQRAHERDGFEWVLNDNAEQSVISFARHGDNPSDDIFVVINFQPDAFEYYRVGVPRSGFWREAFNTDRLDFGGSNVTNAGLRIASEEQPWHRRKESIEFRLPPLAGVVFKYEGALPDNYRKKRERSASIEDAEVRVDDDRKAFEEAMAARG